MSKNFKPKYELDLVNNYVNDIDSLNTADICGKVNASELTVEDITELVVHNIISEINDKNAEALVVYKDGSCELVDTNNINKAIDTITNFISTTVEGLLPKKKEPWYKRLWHKIFPKKNK